MFYRSQFWRLQKQIAQPATYVNSFIGHNFGDYKNSYMGKDDLIAVLSVTILETTKTGYKGSIKPQLFYRSQFWRLQKQVNVLVTITESFIGHNFGDYKNLKWYQLMTP